jgi:riboflavin kinase / FMN adenylyltransferase
MPLAVLHSPEQWTLRFGAAAQTVLSVGNFDGLHLGHQKILRLVLARARATSHVAAVVTFDPHPLRVLRPENAPRLIETLEQRLAGLEQIGMDAALVLRFDRALSLLSPEEFLQRILVDRLRLAGILVGANFRFGHRGAGDVRLLAQFGKQHNFEVEIVPPVEIEGTVVSSTAARNAIVAGQVKQAAQLLGHPFSLTGKIRSGEGRGRAILFPTLNLDPEQELLPKLGVYATESAIEGRLYPSVTNVGTRPTFDGHGVTVESHLLGFHGEMMQATMEVRFHARLREEKKFSGPEQLRAQIARDISAARDFFAQRGVPEHSLGD